MDEMKTLWKRIGVYYLLLAVGILPCAGVIPDRFPTRNLSAIYLLLLTVCLVLYYAHRVSPAGGLSTAIKALSWMGLLLILLRGVKYSAFSEVGVLARHTWYLYYVPLLLLPLLLFDIALRVSPEKKAGSARLWRGTLTLTVVLIALVLTNDLHQQAFRFQPGFAGWDDAYSHGWLFYAVTFWQYALYLASILILVRKCRIGSARKNAWILLLPFGIGIAMNLLLLTGKMPKLNGVNLVEFPEALICMVAVVLECCMHLGLIPTNTDYGRLFQRFSIAAQITDRTGTPVYASHAAPALTPAQFAMESGARIAEHTVLHKMPLPGGFGFWLDDMTEPDRLNDALEEAKEGLAQEAELIRLRNELKEKQTKLEQRTLTYDTIAKRTQRQSQAISRLAEQGRAAADPAEKDACRRRITLLGACIKRYANLMLLSQESSALEAGELGISVSEVLRYLNYCGIPGEFIGGADCAVPAGAALAAFEAFETLLEANLPFLQGVFVNLSAQENVTFKMTLENLFEPLSDDGKQRLSDAGVSCEVQTEDGVTYLCLTLPKGGGSV